MIALAQIAESVWRRRGLVGNGLFVTLVPPSMLYGLATRGRNLLYDLGWRRAQRVPVPVISVGNLNVGGTGKTPVVLWLAQALHGRGHRVGILSRGYRRRSRGVRIVAEGGRVLLDVEEAGDEPVLIGRRVSALVVVGEKRAAAAKVAVAKGANVLILDDGFQHRGLARDFDLLLLDGRQPVSSGWTLPAGPLREPIRGARRADAALMMLPKGGDGGCGAPSDSTKAFDRLGLRGKLTLGARVEPRAVVFSDNGQWREESLGGLAGRRLLAVSGIAGAERFHAMLLDLGCEIANTLVFPDHHRYDRGDWRAINAAARNVDLVVTTEKDLVKLEKFPFAQGGLGALRIAAEIDEHERLLDAVSAAIDGFRRTHANPVS